MSILAVAFSPPLQRSDLSFSSKIWGLKIVLVELLVTVFDSGEALALSLAPRKTKKYLHVWRIVEFSQLHREMI